MQGVFGASSLKKFLQNKTTGKTLKTAVFSENRMCFNVKRKKKSNGINVNINAFLSSAEEDLNAHDPAKIDGTAKEAKATFEKEAGKNSPMQTAHLFLISSGKYGAKTRSTPPKTSKSNKAKIAVKISKQTKRIAGVRVIERK